jgi:hypothetical protein
MAEKSQVFQEHRRVRNIVGEGLKGLEGRWDSEGFEKSLPKRGDTHAKLILNWLNDQ